MDASAQYSLFACTLIATDKAADVLLGKTCCWDTPLFCRGWPDIKATSLYCVQSIQNDSAGMQSTSK